MGRGAFRNRGEAKGRQCEKDKGRPARLVQGLVNEVKGGVDGRAEELQLEGLRSKDGDPQVAEAS